MLYLVAALAIITTASALAVIWACLAAGELKEKMRYVEYALNVLFYNDFVHNLASQEITPEEEFNLALLQKSLTEQAKEIGVEFNPFSRPVGADGPD